MGVVGTNEVGVGISKNRTVSEFKAGGLVAVTVAAAAAVAGSVRVVGWLVGWLVAQ